MWEEAADGPPVLPGGCRNQHWRHLLSRGRCDSCSHGVAGSPTPLKVLEKEHVLCGERREAAELGSPPHTWPQQPAVGGSHLCPSMCNLIPQAHRSTGAGICYGNPILCLHTCRDGELTTTPP